VLFFFSAPQVAKTQCERVLPGSPTFNSDEITKQNHNPLAMASKFPNTTFLHLLFRRSKIVGITQGRINSSVQAINLLLSEEDNENTIQPFVVDPNQENVPILSKILMPAIAHYTSITSLKIHSTLTTYSKDAFKWTKNYS
jgi:hypothetical protein